MFSLCRGNILPQNSKKRIKSIVGSPTTKLGIGKLRSTILPSRRRQRHYLALAQGAKKALKHVSGVLLKPQRGAFGKSVRRKLKSCVLRGQEALFPEVSLPKARRCHRVPCFAQPSQPCDSYPMFCAARGPRRHSIHPWAMFCAAGRTGFVQDEGRRTLRNVRDEACQRT